MWVKRKKNQNAKLGPSRLYLKLKAPGGCIRGRRTIYLRLKGHGGWVEKRGGH